MSFKKELFENVIISRNLQKLHEENEFKTSLDFAKVAADELYKQVDAKAQIIETSKRGAFGMTLQYDLQPLIEKRLLSTSKDIMFAIHSLELRLKEEFPELQISKQDSEDKIYVNWE